MPVESGWKRCTKCQCLIGPTNRLVLCPGGGDHALDNGTTYFLAMEENFVNTQANWRLCANCSALYSGSPDPTIWWAGTCEARDTDTTKMPHMVAVGSKNYKILHNDVTSPGQDNWRWCNKCAMMHFASSGLGPCPAGGQHDVQASGNYKIMREGEAISRVQVILERLFCFSTTETGIFGGHDEVYFLVGSSSADPNSGQPLHYRGPDGSQGADVDNQTAWDMNDSGAVQDRHFNAVLYDRRLDKDTSSTLIVSLCESDGTSFAETVKGAGELAKELSADPRIKVGGGLVAILSRFIPTNQDDILGAFGFTFKNADGMLQILEAGPGQGTVWGDPWDPLNGVAGFRFVQDSEGDYYARLRVRAL